jgi:uncharacterized protein YcbX
MLTLDRITVYPIKSLDGAVVERARVLPSGGLEYDRRWQLVDMEGRVVNAKRTPLLHVIRAEYGIDGLGVAAPIEPARGANTVTLAIDPVAVTAGLISAADRLAAITPEIFSLVPGTAGPCAWLSEVLGCGVLLVERSDGGFPDDREAPGPTLAATTTLIEVARWFGFDLAECRRRFRVNLEIGGCDAFWEDTLASPVRRELFPPLADVAGDLPTDPYADLPPPEPHAVAIGPVVLRVTNVCRRCVVPSRDSRTGSITEHFRDAFEARRQRGLRPDVDAAAWTHWYRLAVNTEPVRHGPVACGDAVRLA